MLLLGAMMLFGNLAVADTCFIAKEKDQVLKTEGDCNTAYAPESTFKIALSLIGFDSGFLRSESDPSWSLPDGVDPYINVCKEDRNPGTWIRDSCLWFSRILTTKLGMEKFQDYVTKFSYGNRDLSGGLTSVWVSSSLKISPEGQTEFLQKVVDQKLPVSQKSYNITKKIKLCLSKKWPGVGSFMAKLVTVDSLTKTVIKQICSTGGLWVTLKKATAG
jgi:beta-lactamase class D